MTDQRVEKFADILINHSTRIKKDELVVISADIEGKDLVLELYKQILKKGAYPKINISLPKTNYTYYKYASEKQIRKFPKLAMIEAKMSQVYIGIISGSNTRELTNIDPKRIALRQKVTNSISDYIVNGKPKIRRVTTLYPSNSLAQEANMSLQEYEDFVFNAIVQDWEKESKIFERIHKLFQRKNEVRIIGEDTDIKMSVKNRPFIIDRGEENMPGGEMFAAPIKTSVEGHIRFTYPAIRSGQEVENVYLEFKKGKVVKAKASKNEKFLKAMINTDAGSKYIGELGIGLNKRIDRFTKDLLFDEKIGGTIHLALGMAYKECKGDNKSALHWDIVKDLRRNGEIIVDGKIVQKKGKFIL